MKAPSSQATRKERGCLHLDDPIVVCRAQFEIIAPLSLNDLARANIRGGIRDAPADRIVAEACRQSQRMSEEAVSQQNADGISPFGVGGRLITPQLRPIHDIVMNKSRDVNHLNNDGEIDVSGGNVPGSPARQERQNRPQPLTTLLAEISHVTLDRRVKCSRLFSNSRFNRIEMRIDELERLGERRTFPPNAGQFCEFIHRSSILSASNLVNG